MVAVGSVFVVVVAVLGPEVRARGRRARAPLPVLDHLGAVGRWIAARLPFDTSVSGEAVGAVAAASVVMLIVAPPLVIAPPLGLALVDAGRGRRRARRQRRAVEAGLPEVVDHLLMGVAAGLALRDALSTAVAWMPPPFAAVGVEVGRRAEAGEAFVVAFDTGFSALGPSVRQLVTVVAAAEHDGAPLVPALERLGDETRRMRRVAAEEAARRAPVMLLFPLVLCVLPAFALLSVVPLLLDTFSGLELPAGGF